MKRIFQLVFLMISHQKKENKLNASNFDEIAKKEFISGAKIAYESIITNFASGNIKEVKNLLGKSVFDQFDAAIKERNSKGLLTETTFVGISSANIKNHKQNNNMLEVTVAFVSEIISCVKDKNKKIMSGNPDK